MSFVSFPKVPPAAPRHAAYRAWWYWTPAVGYAALIFFLSSLSSPEIYVPSQLMELGDKVLHGIEYGVLGILMYRAFRYAAGPWSASHALLLAIVASTAYGLTDEIHQLFVPLRDADVWDLLTDAVGSSVAAWAWARFIEPALTRSARGIRV
ncbi:MAG TPA: VanZ family protein [Nitrospirales bacterium]|jgi:VanZ family protein